MTEMIDKWKLREWMLMPDDDMAQAVERWLQPFHTNWTYNGVIIDPDKYEIKPKDSFRKELIENKEARLKSLQSEQEQLKKEIEELKRK